MKIDDLVSCTWEGRKITGLIRQTAVSEKTGVAHSAYVDFPGVGLKWMPVELLSLEEQDASGRLPELRSSMVLAIYYTVRLAQDGHDKYDRRRTADGMAADASRRLLLKRMSEEEADFIYDLGEKLESLLSGVMDSKD